MATATRERPDGIYFNLTRLVLLAGSGFILLYHLALDVGGDVAGTGRNQLRRHQPAKQGREESAAGLDALRYHDLMNHNGPDEGDGAPLDTPGEPILAK